jgi:uncharacterized protein YbaR (Trm112 family)
MKCPYCDSKDLAQVTTTSASTESGLIKCYNCMRVFNIITSITKYRGETTEEEA